VFFFPKLRYASITYTPNSTFDNFSTLSEPSKVFFEQDSILFSYTTSFSDARIIFKEPDILRLELLRITFPDAKFMERPIKNITTCTLRVINSFSHTSSFGKLMKYLHRSVPNITTLVFQPICFYRKLLTI